MTDLRTSEHDSGSCPACDAPFEAVTAAPGNAQATPSPGDVSVCPYCAFVGVYDDGLHVVKIPRDRATRILADESVQALAAYWRANPLPRPDRGDRP